MELEELEARDAQDLRFFKACTGPGSSGKGKLLASLINEDEGTFDV